VRGFFVEREGGGDAGARDMRFCDGGGELEVVGSWDVRACVCGVGGRRGEMAE
jgi:hypothetical protein